MARNPQLWREQEARKKAEAEAKGREAEASARRAEAEAQAARARAEAEAARARAEAEAAKARAEAELRAQELANARAREEREAAERRQAAERAEAIRQEKLARENNPAEKAWKISTALAGAGTGAVVGHKLANRIEARQTALRQAAAPELARLAKQAAPALAKAQAGTAKAQAAAVAKLAGVVTAADKMRLTATRGPTGLAMAGLLLAEGGFARFVLAREAENPYARDALNAAGTASLFAATAMVGERLVQNATPVAVKGAASLATIEEARQVVQRAAPGLMKVPTVAERIKAAIAAAPKSRAAAAVAAVAAVNAGLYQLVAGGKTQASAGAAAQPPSGGPQAPQGSSPLEIARAAAGRTADEMAARQTIGTRADGAPPGLDSDGFTEAYTRQQNGRTVHVQGYRTPK